MFELYDRVATFISDHRRVIAIVALIGVLAAGLAVFNQVTGGEPADTPAATTTTVVARPAAVVAADPAATPECVAAALAAAVVESGVATSTSTSVPVDVNERAAAKRRQAQQRRDITRTFHMACGEILF